MLQVRAEDRDTVASVTYQLVRGDVTRFSVDPATGEVRTLAAGPGLDYELQREHVLTIGTREAELAGAGAGAGAGATTTLTVTVLDVSDVPPTWTQLPPGNTIQVSTRGYTVKILQFQPHFPRTLIEIC